MKNIEKIILIGFTGCIVLATMNLSISKKLNQTKESYDSLKTKYDNLKQNNSKLMEIAKKYNSLGKVISQEDTKFLENVMYEAKY